MNRVLLIFLCLALPAHASKVIKVNAIKQQIVIKQHKKRPWKTDQRICIYNKKNKVACGRITKVTKKKALVKILFQRAPITKGMRARLVKSRSPSNKSTHLGREPKLIETAELITPPSDEGELAQYGITAGVSVGLHHFFPMLHFQRALTRHWAVGVEPLYLSSSDGSDSLSAVGGFFTVNYYSYKPFRGMWVQGALGYYAFEATAGTSQQASSSMAVLGTFGWREKWVWGLNLAVGAGIQYVVPPKIDVISVTFSSIQLNAVLEAGYTF